MKFTRPIGGQDITFSDKLNNRNELEIEIEGDRDYTGQSIYISIGEMQALREHIDRILNNLEDIHNGNAKDTLRRIPSDRREEDGGSIRSPRSMDAEERTSS